MTTYEKLKICLLTVFVIGLLSFFYSYSKNGRFMAHSSSPIILNTQTGEVYILPKMEKIEIEKFKSK